jgi:hypothetical protein
MIYDLQLTISKMNPGILSSNDGKSRKEIGASQRADSIRFTIRLFWNLIGACGK